MKNSQKPRQNQLIVAIASHISIFFLGNEYRGVVQIFIQFSHMASICNLCYSHLSYASKLNMHANDCLIYLILLIIFHGCRRKIIRIVSWKCCCFIWFYRSIREWSMQLAAHIFVNATYKFTQLSINCHSLSDVWIWSAYGVGNYVCIVYLTLINSNSGYNFMNFPNIDTNRGFFQ